MPSPTTQVRADQVREGQTVTSLGRVVARIGSLPLLSIRRPRWSWSRPWPTVTQVEYVEHSLDSDDGCSPMVYIQLSDRPDGVCPLYPRDLVTVLDRAGSGEAP